MKKLLKIALLSLVCLLTSSSFAQQIFSERITTYTPQVVYNYENKFKIVWPLFFNGFSNKPKLEMIHETQPIVAPLVALLGKIENQIKSDEPLIIHVDFQNKFSETTIDKQNGSLDFTFRDTLLEFDGKHHLIVNSSNRPPIDIYFNEVSDLHYLSKIEFQLLENFIVADAINHTHNSLHGKKEIVYISQNGELKPYGLIGREKQRTIGLTAMIGGMLAYSKAGIGLNTQLNLLNYKQGNDNQKQLFNKLSLDLKSYFFEGTAGDFSALYSSFGLSALGNQQLIGSNLPIDMIGFGIGVFSLSGLDNYIIQTADPNVIGKFITYTDNQLNGVHFSIIGELQKFYISYYMNLGVFNKSKERSSFGSLNLAYKF
jgi:hypothetical protein